jgi:3',5'-cyclic-AMP phosphodiesterase
MPITLPPISRRRFLKGALAAGALAVLPRDVWSAPQSQFDANRIALLSDTHLPAAGESFVHRDVSPWKSFQTASTEILSLDPLPANVMINGDVAFSRGHPEDYARIVDGLKPLREAGLPVHLGLGNHDNRENLTAACGLAEHRVAALSDHRVMRVELPHTDWYVLDSLFQTKITPGTLGPGQLTWLQRSLDARPHRPAVLMLHHQPQTRPSVTAGWNGLTDTIELLAIIQPRRQVKAILFGHTHKWEHYVSNGLHFINLPTTAHIFKEEQPRGWVDARLTQTQMTLQLHSLTPGHWQDKQLIEFPWR